MDDKITYTWSDELADMPDTANVKVTLYNDYADTITYNNNSSGTEALQNNRRISATQYVDDNGEIHDYDYSRKNRSIESTKESIKKIRKYIVYNFNDFECWHITLTYKIQEFDFTKAARDCDLFLDRLATRYNEYKIEYLRVIEPHKNGAWHIHILVKSSIEGVHIKLSNSVISKIWGLGNTTANQVYSVDNIAAYLGTAHSEIKNTAHKLSKTEQKQLRWRYYPKGERIYTKSNGIKSPPSSKMSNSELSAYLSEQGYDIQSDTQSSLRVSDAETGAIINTVNYQTFQKKK